MNIIQKTYFVLAFFVCAQLSFAEPPDTKWKVTGPANYYLTITEVVDEGVNPWIFTLYKPDGSFKATQAGDSAVLNFRTIDLSDSKYSGYVIKFLNTNSWRNNTTIKELYWPDTITSISANSFLNCSNLKICDYPQNTKMTSIGNYAFSGCKNLTHLTMLDTISYLGEDPFSSCTKLVFDGPMLPNSYTSIYARRFNSIKGKPLKDGLLVVGGAGKPVTWVPYNNKNNNNQYFTGLNITNLIFGAGVANAGTNYYANYTKYNPYGGCPITNIVVQNPGVFAFGEALSYSSTATPKPTTVRNYDVAGYITGTLIAHSTTYNTRIVAPKDKYWGEFKKGVTSNDYKPWNEISDETKAKYWEYFNDGVEGTGDEIPHGVVLKTTSYTITVDGETIDPLTIPGGVWVVFKPGEWPEMELTPVAKPSAVTGLSYNGSEQVGVLEGVGYTITGHKATAAGTYTATATLKEGYKWADGSVDDVTIEWSIDMGVVQIPSAVTGLTYNGSEQTGVMEGEGYTLTGNKATQIGTHTATATLKENYKWSDGSVEEKVITWVIAVGAVEVPFAVEGLKYNGKEQGGVLEGEGYTLTNHKATDVGSYTATATLMEGYVWADGTSADKEISWTIALGIAQVPVAVPNLHYNGKEQTGVLEGAGYTLTNNKATEIGTYTATATLVDAAKYIWSDGTVEAKTIEWEIGLGIAQNPVAILGLQYNGKTQTGVKSGTGYTLTGNTGKAVGTYTATATLLDGYMWEDGTLDPKTITWSIAEEVRDPEPEPLPDPEPDSEDTPASIIYVNPAATGANNGTSWADAYTDFKVALGKITVQKNVIWFAGTFTCSADCVVTIPNGVKAKIRGGFKGTEATAAEREEGVKSVVSGKVRAYKTLEISSDSALRIERIRFIESKERGIYKKGAGDLTLVDCDMIACGYNLGKSNGLPTHGRGFVMVGTPGKTRLFATRCTFAGNRTGYETLYDAGNGQGAAFMNLARATLDDCLFVTNGLPVLNVPSTYGFRYFKGSALYATNAPVTIRGTKFLFNRAVCSQEYDQTYDVNLMGATVRLEAGTGRSVFTNCLWMANQNARGINNSTHISRGGGGEIFFNPGKTYAECEVVNCTFAANLNHISKNGGCGVNVRSGKMKILNSIFSDNISITTGSTIGKDIYVADGAEVNVSYSMLSPDKSGDRPIYAAGPGTLNIGEGVIFDRANFVSRVEEASYMRSVNAGTYFYLPVALDYLINLNVHLRSKAGYYDFGQNKRIRSYSENSPALDAGDPKSDYSKEPYASWGYHGRRVNMGFYGNTPEAAATRYKGFFVKVVGGESAPKEEVEVIGKPDNTVPVEDIIVCDGADYSVKIYRGSEVVWKWKASTDPALAGNTHNDIRGRFNGLTETRVCDYNGKKVVAISSSNCAWAIVDIATTNAIAYGYSRTAGQSVRNTIMPHSIDLLPNDIVAVASTYTIDQNEPETKYGCYFYHIAGDKATSYQDPAKQGATFFSIENPHGFYWDNDNKKLYVSSSEGLTRLSVTFNSEANKFDIVEEAVFGIAQLGAKWGHDLAVVPGTRILAMTAYEMTLFFDMDKEKWLLDEIIWRMDQKGFDPHKDKIHFLSTVPRTDYVTDTLEVWTKENGFKEYLKVPGAKFYKARWAGGVLDSITK